MSCRSRRAWSTNAIAAFRLCSLVDEGSLNAATKIARDRVCEAQIRVNAVPWAYQDADASRRDACAAWRPAPGRSYGEISDVVARPGTSVSDGRSFVRWIDHLFAFDAW